MIDASAPPMRMRFSYESRCRAGTADGERHERGTSGPDVRRQPRDRLPLVGTISG